MSIGEIELNQQKDQVEKIQSVATSENVKQTEMKQDKVKAEEQTLKTNAEKMTYEETNEIVKALESYMDVLQTNIGFSVNSKTEKVIVTVTNKETNEVIRQIPPEELVALQEKMKELTGFIFSEMV